MRPENTLLERESKAASVQIYQSLKKHPKAVQEVAEALGEPFSLQAAHTAVLVMVHALAQTRGKNGRTRGRALKLWEKTLDPQSRFLPIVPLALRLLKALPPRTAKQALPGMLEASEQLNDPAGAGRIVQKLAYQRKHLAVYHTLPESAALMARLAIPEGLDWSDPKTVTGYRMADYSCGAGALLIAAYQRVRELHQQSGGSPRKVHAAVLEESITAGGRVARQRGPSRRRARRPGTEASPARRGHPGPHASVRTHQQRNATIPRRTERAGTPRHRAGQPGSPGSRRA